MVTATEVQGLTLIPIGDRVLVESSMPGQFYAVRDGECECKGYQYRQTCKHVRAVSEHFRPAAPAPKPVCPRCGGELEQDRNGQTFCFRCTVDEIWN